MRRTAACPFLSLFPLFPLFALLSASSCSDRAPSAAGTASGRPAPLAAAEPPRLPDEELTLGQRRRGLLADRRTSIQLGDITRGRVDVTVFDGARIVAGPEHLAPGEALRFTLGGHDYRLDLVALKNRLFGEDEARLRVGPAPEQAAGAPAPTGAARERQRVDALLDAVERADLRFERNGTAHDARDAAGHLRRKRDYAGERIRTAEEFIEHIASASSLSGRPYHVVKKDGTRVPTGEWLRQRLMEIDAEIDARIDAKKGH